MVTRILEFLASFVISVISTMGLPGIVLLMAIESACIPLPSEVIMPFSGYLVFLGKYSLWSVGLAGAFGCVVGSVPAYYLGMYGGRPLIEKYGKYILISRHDLDMADRWFERHGEATVFFARLLPVIRTFIAFPAGVSRMEMKRFILYTFAGSLPWCLGLAYVGMVMGEKWPILREYFHKFDLLIGAVIVAAIVWYVRRHLKHRE
ncbi:MAG: DedA family protein [Deltaproteobacteria bacterium]|jgi:membrane protein DedA with SNARE-associated domain|nr:MAG: DedA family protein [Deltaproteobacteria bacterium]